MAKAARRAAGSSGAASSSDFKEGDRVKFAASHNKALELVGKVVKVHESGDLVDVEADVDGKIIEVEGHIHTLPVEDVKAAGESESHRHVGDGSR